MDVDWRPLRPLRSTVALVVNKASGGRWQHELALEAGEAEADDVISIEAAIGKTSAVSFKLSNVFEADAAFIAYFTPESPAVFSVRPPAGILSSAGSDGQLFTVGYSPTEYGKALKGTLLITTDEMQWVYGGARRPPALRGAARHDGDRRLEAVEGRARRRRPPPRLPRHQERRVGGGAEPRQERAPVSARVVKCTKRAEIEVRYYPPAATSSSETTPSPTLCREISVASSPRRRAAARKWSSTPTPRSADATGRCWCAMSTRGGALRRHQRVERLRERAVRARLVRDVGAEN